MTGVTRPAWTRARSLRPLAAEGAVSRGAGDRPCGQEVDQREARHRYGAAAPRYGSNSTRRHLAGAGSFTHIRDTAAQHGQHGPMSWAVAVCIDLTCAMAARERQRDKQLGITTRQLSWPTVALAGG